MHYIINSCIKCHFYTLQNMMTHTFSVAPIAPPIADSSIMHYTSPALKSPSNKLYALNFNYDTKTKQLAYIAIGIASGVLQGPCMHVLLMFYKI